MRHTRHIFAGICIAALTACGAVDETVAPIEADAPALAAATFDPAAFTWNNAAIYFLMTDRFRNGDPSNDTAYGRQADGDVLRSFEGGDIPGIIEKLESGYFKDLGVTAIWTTPVIEQIHGPFEEFGTSYPFHGYWPRDWTKVDEAYGTEADLARMIELAHSQGIRVLIDIIVNHAGPPIDERDPAWPSDWVDTGPRCDYESYAGTVDCLIVPALQEMRTESNEPVDLPPHIIAKWEAEGRLESEMAELDAFFERTGLPRTPRNYLIKWNTDWVRDYGVDGYRIDTAKHVEAEVWAQLKAEAELALAEWRAGDTRTNDWDTPFYMFGEVFNFGVDGFDKTVPGTRRYDYGDVEVDFFDYDYDALLNMGFATHAAMEPEQLFETYAAEMAGPFVGVSVVSYISSHDDGNPRDPERTDSWMNAAKLVLAPGAVQVYYGDETDRKLVADNAVGDAKLRTPMNWDDVDSGATADIQAHWSRLLTFRKNHPSIGAGTHQTLSSEPFAFSRTLGNDTVVVGLDRDPFEALSVGEALADGSVRDAYTGETLLIENGTVQFPSARTIALLER